MATALLLAHAGHGAAEKRFPWWMVIAGVVLVIAVGVTGYLRRGR